MGTLANPAEMIRQGAPRLLHSDKELAEYTDALMALTAKAKPTIAEEEAIDLFTLLIEQYESQQYPVFQTLRLPRYCVSCLNTKVFRSATW